MQIAARKCASESVEAKERKRKKKERQGKGKKKKGNTYVPITSAATLGACSCRKVISGW